MVRIFERAIYVPSLLEGRQFSLNVFENDTSSLKLHEFESSNWFVSQGNAQERTIPQTIFGRRT